MSFFKKIGNVLKKVVRAVKKALSRVFKFLKKHLRPLLAIGVFALIVFAPYLATLTFGPLTAWIGTAAKAIAGLEMGFGVSAAVGLGAAYIVDPKTTGSAVNKVVDAAGKVAGAAAQVVGGAAKGFLTSPLGLALLAGGGFLLYREKRLNDGHQTK